MVLALVSLLFALPCQTAPASPDPKPQEPSLFDVVVAARSKRLAEEKTALEKSIAAIDAFGHAAEFVAAVEKLARAEYANEEGVQLIALKDGTATGRTLLNFTTWQKPLPDRRAGSTGVPAAIDLAVENHPFAAIVDTEKQLRERSIDLLVVVVPGRIEVYPELVPGFDVPIAEGAGFVGIGAETQRFLLALNATGVETLDLQAAFAAERFGKKGDGAPDRDDQLFLRSDPHWTPRGAELAARLVAARLAEIPWFRARGPLKEGTDFELCDRAVVTEPSEKMVAAGAKPESLAAHVLRHGERPFDAVDEKSALLVMGDSYVRFYDGDGCDFCSELARFTGRKIDRISTPAGAQQACRDAARRRPAKTWDGKRLVIWLLPTTNFAVRKNWAPMRIVPE